MTEKSFLIPTFEKGYIEEIVIIAETRELRKYLFSNNLDNMEIAIYERTGLIINLEKAIWKQNAVISVSVKRLMYLYNVNYSFSTGINDKENFVVVNMRVGDKWFITGFFGIKKKVYNLEFDGSYSEKFKVVRVIRNESNSSSSYDIDDE